MYNVQYVLGVVQRHEVLDGTEHKPKTGTYLSQL